MFGMESRFSFVSTAGFAFFFGKANTNEATAADYPVSARVSRVGDDISSSRTSRKRLFRRDAESPSRTGVTRETRALPGTQLRHARLKGAARAAARIFLRSNT